MCDYCHYIFVKYVFHILYFGGVMVEAEQPKQPLEDQWYKGWFGQTCTGMDGHKRKCRSFCVGRVRLLQVQRDAHVSQLLDRQQWRDDVLAKAVVYKHLRGRRQQTHTVSGALHRRLVTSRRCNLISGLDSVCGSVRALLVSSYLPYWLSCCVLWRRGVEVEHPLQSDCQYKHGEREKASGRWPDTLSSEQGCWVCGGGGGEGGISPALVSIHRWTAPCIHPTLSNVVTLQHRYQALACTTNLAAWIKLLWPIWYIVAILFWNVSSACGKGLRLKFKWQGFKKKSRDIFYARVFWWGFSMCAIWLLWL